MANLITYRHTNSTDALYFIVVRDSDGAHIIAATGDIDADPTTGEWDNYDVTMTEVEATQLYTGTFPASTPIGQYKVYVQVNVAKNASDAVVDTIPVYWNGTAIINILDVILGDFKINTSDAAQWKWEVLLRGTSTVLVTKDMNDINAAPVINIITPVAQQLD